MQDGYQVALQVIGVGNTMRLWRDDQHLVTTRYVVPQCDHCIASYKSNNLGAHVVSYLKN